MPSIKVRQYRCYAADKRLSMDIYADNLVRSVQSSRVSISPFRPRSRLERFSELPLVMRYLRYVHYARLVQDKRAHIHHIIDHGYAHLHPRLGSGKKCITVHDLIPLLHWKGQLLPVGESDKVRKPWLNLHSLSYLNRFDSIIADSDSTANDLVNYLNIDRALIDVIPLVIGAQFSPASDEDIYAFTERYQLDRTCKWIMVSGQEFYKNHPICLQVLKDLRDNHSGEIKLVRAGRPSADFDEIVVKLGLEQSVKTIYLEHQHELPMLYSFVSCLLFPSLYEGFGMPVAEALACGTPAVISDRGSLPEVGGKLCPTLNPYDVKGLSHAVYRMLFDDAARAYIQQEGPSWVRQFRTEAVAPKVEAVYQRLMSES